METFLASQTPESLKAKKVEAGLTLNGGDDNHGINENGLSNGAHHGLNGNGDEDSSDEEVEVEEVKDELETLKADTLYHDFCLDVSLNR